MLEEEDVGFIGLIYRYIWNDEKYSNHDKPAGKKRWITDVCLTVLLSRGFAKDEDSDMYLYPDLNTFEIFPWRPQQGKVARLICDVYRQDGTPFENDPRHILKKTVEKQKLWDINYK